MTNHILRYIFALFVCFCWLSDIEAQTIFNVQQKDVDSAFVVLDSVIERREEYSEARYASIRERERKLTKATSKQKIEILQLLISENMKFRSKDLLKWISMLKATTEYNEGGDLYFWTECREAQCYSIMGLTHKAISTLRELQAMDNNNGRNAIHNDILLQRYNWELSTFNMIAPLSNEEEQEHLDFQHIIYKDSLSETVSTFARISEILNRDRVDEALNILKQLYGKVEGQDQVDFYASMAEYYMHKKDTTGIIYALAMASIQDGRMANADYVCLPMLVDLLYKKGNIDRAYKLMISCIEDSRLYPSYFLFSETNILPIINNKYKTLNSQKQRNYKIARYLGAFVMLTLLCLAFVIVYTRIKTRMANKLEKTNAELMKANEVKTAFIHNMTHELHTPLNTVCGFSQVLEDGVEDFDMQTIKTMARNINEGMLQLNQQLDNMLMLSSIECVDSGSNTLDEVKVDDMLEKIKQMVEIPAGKKITFKTINNADPGYVIHTESYLLTKAIMLLVDNAIKFTPEGEVILSAEKKNDGLIFAVTDEGIGIPKGMDEKIFERFFKIDAFIHGSGLGLSLCRTLMNIIDGRVYVDRKHKGKGTRMVLQLNIFTPKVQKSMLRRLF